MNFKDFFKDRKGRVVIAQKPNPPLLIALGFYLLGFLPFDYSDLISNWGVPITLLYWSYLEIVDGASLFRKTFGIIVFSYSLIKIFQLVI